jgi:23S rRNA (adenine2503-C2)-methyltransferase
MKVIASTGKEDVAIVYIVEFEDGRMLECVEAVSPPLPRENKWVLLVSTMFGCPIGCMMCDAGGYYHGKTSAEMIYAQLDFLIYKRFPNGCVPSRQFKIQFARMGEPTLNPNVLTVLDELPDRYCAPGLMPSISTVAPHGSQKFFDRLIEIKRKKYAGGNFQFQFSLHTTDLGLRDKIIPAKKWSFQEMAAYGERFFSKGDRKITLNFALAQDLTLDPDILLEYFTPEKFLIKITPLNPTYRASANRLSSYIDPNQSTDHYAVVDALRKAGYDVIISIGELEENYIGSNCGQYLQRHLKSSDRLSTGYTYNVQNYSEY